MNFFSKAHAFSIWPGYLATIDHYENKFLLGVEVIHKVVRQETALIILEKLRNRGDFKVDVLKCYLVK